MNISDMEDPRVLIFLLLATVSLVVLTIRASWPNWIRPDHWPEDPDEGKDDTHPKAEIDPCPYCGQRKAMVTRAEDTLFRVRCPGCQALGPLGMSDGHARSRWNNRILRIG